MDAWGLSAYLNFLNLLFHNEVSFLNKNGLQASFRMAQKWRVPNSFLAKQCIEDPPVAPNTDKGWYDWNGNKTYTAIIKYECKNPGWGYPSNGNATMHSECLADQTWSLTKVEKCICKLKFFQYYFVFYLWLFLRVYQKKKPPFS